MRSFGPPYPTGEWDATFTIGELCNNDDPRGMLAWAALNYDPHKRDEQDVDDRLAGLMVEIYALRDRARRRPRSRPFGDSSACSPTWSV